MKITKSQAQELKKVLKSIPDNRKANGLRHSQASVWAIAICAVLNSIIILIFHMLGRFFVLIDTFMTVKRKVNVKKQFRGHPAHFLLIIDKIFIYKTLLQLW